MYKNSFPEPSEKFHQRVMDTLSALPEQKESSVMKTVNFKKSIIIAAAVILTVGCAALASSKMATIYGSSNAKPEYTSMPSAAECEKIVKTEPTLPEQFSNGYAFFDCSVEKKKYEDENETIKFKGLNYRYKKDNSRIEIHIQKSGIYPDEKNTPPTYSQNGVDMYYVQSDMKFVPDGYALTDEDKEDEKSGKYIFSYGSDSVEIHHTESLTFDFNGTKYCIFSMDNTEANSEALYRMALEIIN